MRATFLALLLLLSTASAVEAQACRAGPLPPMMSLFPDEIDGMPRQLYTVADGCATNFYRPRDSKPGDGTPWAAVMIEPHADPFLGEDPDALARHWTESGIAVHDVAGWPVSYQGHSELGHKFVTLKDRVRVTILVKETDDQAVGTALADRMFAAILPDILFPCT